MQSIFKACVAIYVQVMIKLVRILLLSLITLSTFSTGESFVFPFGRCYDRACGSSPYQFIWLRNATSAGKLCFRIEQKSCSDSKYSCCSIFQKNLQKFVIYTKGICKNAVENVYINGKRRAGGVFFDLYNEGKHAELRVTNLDIINANNAENTTVCLDLKKPCDNVLKFCKRIRKGEACQYALWETARHECCATCRFKKQKTI